MLNWIKRSLLLTGLPVLAFATNLKDQGDANLGSLADLYEDDILYVSRDPHTSGNEGYITGLSLSKAVAGTYSTNQAGIVGDWNPATQTGTDQTSALQTFFNYCSSNDLVAVISPGKYLLTHDGTTKWSIRIGAPIHIKGAGQDKSFFYTKKLDGLSSRPYFVQNPANDLDWIRMGDVGIVADGSVLEDFTLFVDDMDTDTYTVGSGPAVNGISLNYAHNTRIERVTIKGGFGWDQAGGGCLTVGPTSNYPIVRDVILDRNHDDATVLQRGQCAIINSKWGTYTNVSFLNSWRAHGAYVQSGYNTFTSCLFRGTDGTGSQNLSRAVELQAATYDGGGNRFIGCTFEDNNSNLHAIPHDLTGWPTMRYATFSNCVFRETEGFTRSGGAPYNFQSGLGFADPETVDTGQILLENCVFEDIATATLMEPGGVKMVNCVIRYNLNAPPVLVADADDFTMQNCEVYLDGWTTQITTHLIKLKKRCKIIGNTFRVVNLANGDTTDTEDSIILISSAGEESLIADNIFVITTQGNVFSKDSVDPGSSIVIRDNIVIGPEDNRIMYIIRPEFSPILYNNEFDGWIDFHWNASGGPLYDTLFRDNRCKFEWHHDGNRIQVDRDSGTLTLHAGALNIISPGLAYDLDSNLKAKAVTISSTSFMGLTVMRAADTTNADYWLGIEEEGAIAYVTCDTAWTKGNRGQLSTSNAGQFSDTTSQAYPASGAFVTFLDTGGAPGTAKVRIERKW